MQNNEIIKPAKYFSELEKSILLALVEKYKYVLECKKSDARTIALKQRTWQALAHEYNSQPSVSLRDFKQLKKCWENIKARTKKIMAHERREKVKRSVSPLLSTHVLGKEKIASMLPEQLYFLQSPPEEEPEYHPDAAAPELNVRESDVRVCDESSCKYGGVCKEDGDGLKCACQFQCHTNYIPVCGSNGDTYQNECFLRRAACKHQKEITVVARGPCYSDNGSGSGEGEEEGSGAEAHRKHSKCGPCKYKAECDEDAENVGCVCNIDCSGYSFNPVCASDGSSYNNPCFVREASCIKQEQIDIRHLGHCTDTDDTSLLGKKDDGLQYRPDVKDASDQREDVYIGNHMPCPENLNGYCIHGKCEFIYSTRKASCRCESGYTGQHCEKTDFSILYVVPSRQKLTHVLIAAIIGAVQIAIIVAIVMCITRKCPKNNRGRRQKQNLGHFTSDTSSRMV
ncbi:tomoregulin-1 isoform X1 [Marmota marmota marmota]|uniref:Myb/SANT-like DNA-binding domain-containing protein 3 n=1 Tax=Urocitellus parryii TaxID=9999 RepID=A0A8D2KK81_UROPR|nr:tomoregulin-1 [Ictidomys tridecemlineatus]XP_015347748.1 tomoregulin-1 isoform X1 [Marmota marmota marmota]XP_026270935.1 tomoregulin-1 isoform X1 [Urocitellus parryii]XP_026270944.1 tomoregulin-1 isoform X1 [Urocitellus parryii]XP_048639256.1 tomoregulin-1 isoform X1 [Marmota marmota marmota]XP_048639257.1 tomoregulin-1 isoform X1 [Marmota marmota marmota]KAG3287600.1 tomoregulin-1 [Ictidomys tridecemlineatus]